MAGWLLGPILLALAYAAGALPWGYVLGRWVGKIDLREHGSGGTGATNALRTLGWRVSLVVFVLDVLKGFVPVLVARVSGLNDWWIAAVAVAAVVGHCWSPLIGFRGGKGMATGAGAAAAMYPPVLLALPLIFGVIWLTRYVSLGSLLGSVLVSAALVALGLAGLVQWSITLGVLAMTAIIVYQHQGNIRRLLSGTERRLGEPAR
jgi:acyl phosphate:glycerol-3-phosphate acyltransferase